MGILGIDLGTTNSLIAYYDGEKACIIPNRLGENLTPSVVSMDEEGQVFVGRVAWERRVAHERDTIAVFKRNMGADKKVRLAGKDFLPEELSSLVIRALVEDAEAYLNEKVTEVVISVPAYFNDKQRKATKRAGQLAGLTVERLINEPTAAAIAYGLQEKKEQTKFLVVDLGGGTFDVSILELDDNLMEVRSVAGDNYLGGEDFTDVLYQLCLARMSIKDEDLNSRERVILWNAAEAAKRELYEKSSVTINTFCQGEEKSCQVSEEEYETACKGLLLRMRTPIERALGDAAIRLNEIDTIVLVGGATKLQLIRRFLGKLFRKFPVSYLNPDEVVALGAAIQGAMKARNRAIKEMILTDVCPYTLGTSVSVRRENNRYENGHFLPIIERNTVIPVSRVERVYTMNDNQSMIRVDVLQGESRMAMNNILLGELNIPMPLGKAGQESADIRYTYDINGLLEVEVTVVSTGFKSRLMIEQNAGYATEEKIQERMELLQMLKIHPREQEENRLLLSRGERLYEENVGDIRKYIGECLSQFEAVLEKQEVHSVKEAARVFKEQLDQISEQWL